MAEAGVPRCGEGDGEMEEEKEEEEAEKEFLPEYPTLEDYSKALLGQVVKATKIANGLPAEGDDYDYYSSFPGFQTFCYKMGSRVTRSIGRLIRHQGLPCYWPPPQAPPTATPTQGKGVGHVAGTEELEERLDALVEANDILLERVGVLLDEAAGLRKKEEEVAPQALQQGTAEVASWNKKKEVVKEAVGSYSFMASRSVQRPQLRFHDHVDNSNTPFVPLLRSKPNARQPLPEVYQRLQNPMSLNALIANSKEWAQMKQQQYIHPYQYELDNLEPTEEQLQPKEPQAPGGLDDVPFTYVDTEESLEQLLEELKESQEFAIDLEHHSYRSFQGFVCLMQISTRCHDYIVDTLELRHHIHCLLDPFTNPLIVKVMHGAEWDIEWLQRDFGLYVVNLFDTGQASRVLNLPKYSLAFLLQYCCGVEADKQYQLADWRIRPLPPEMEKYAREDTHYLLYIYDRMKNELIRRGNDRQNLLHTVLNWSRDVCLRVYKKKLFGEDDHLKLYFKHKRNFNAQQLRCLQLLYNWRDRVAREEDESYGYVLPNHMLFQISEQLPREAQGVLACCTPIPTLLRQQLQEVYMLVQQARETPFSNELPKLQSQMSGSSAPAPTVTASPSPSHTPHSTPVIITSTESENESVPINRVKISGPPVKKGIPMLSAVEVVGPLLTSKVREQLQQIKNSFPDVLSKFLEAQPMATSEVLSSQTASETPETATPVQATPTSVGQATPPSSHKTPSEERVNLETATETKATGGRKELKSRKILSVREMANKRRKISPPDEGERGREEGMERVVREVEGEEEREEGELIEETEVKRKRGNDRETGFTPFSYQGVDFRDYAKGPSKPVDVFQPFSAPKERQSGPRSKLHMRSGERSRTYTTSSSQHSRHQSWPRRK